MIDEGMAYCPWPDGRGPLTSIHAQLLLQSASDRGGKFCEVRNLGSLHQSLGPRPTLPSPHVSIRSDQDQGQGSHIELTLLKTPRTTLIYGALHACMPCSSFGRHGRRLLLLFPFLSLRPREGPRMNGRTDIHGDELLQFGAASGDAARDSSWGGIDIGEGR